MASKKSVISQLRQCEDCGISEIFSELIPANQMGNMILHNLVGGWHCKNEFECERRKSMNMGKAKEQSRWVGPNIVD